MADASDNNAELAPRVPDQKWVTGRCRGMGSNARLGAAVDRRSRVSRASAAPKSGMGKQRKRYYKTIEIHRE